MSIGRPLDSRVDQEEQLGARLLDTDLRLTRLERQTDAPAIPESIFVVNSFADLPEPQPGMFGFVVSESQWYTESNGSWVVSSSPIPDQNDPSSPVFDKQVVISYGGDVNGPGTGALLLGYQGASSTHMALDGNEIQAYSNGLGSTLNLNIQSPSLVRTGGGLRVDGALTTGGSISTQVAGNQGHISTDYFRANAGSAGWPAFSFAADPNTGMFGAAANVYFSVSGQTTARISKDAVWAYDSSDNSKYMTMGHDGSQARFNATGSYIYFQKGIRVDSGKVGSWNEDLQLGEGNNTNCVISNDAQTAPLRVLTNDTNNNLNAWGYGSGLQLMSGDTSLAKGAMTGIMFQTLYGTGRNVHARLWHEAGNEIGFRNGYNSSWASVKAAVFNIGSDLAYKSRVRRGRDEHHPYLEGVLTGDRQLAFDKHRGVETIVFDDAQQESLTEWAGCTEGRVRDYDAETDDVDDVVWEGVVHSTQDECIKANCKSMHNVVAKEHHCDDFDCGGTNETPCWLVEQHVDRPGFSAQNLEEFYPKVVSKDMNGDNRGANIYGIVAELWNTVDHLIAECEDLRAALSAVEGASLSPRPRGGSILPVEPFRKGQRVTQ